jgi:hypothetical protein
MPHRPSAAFARGDLDTRDVSEYSRRQEPGRVVLFFFYESGYPKVREPGAGGLSARRLVVQAIFLQRFLIVMIVYDDADYCASCSLVACDWPVLDFPNHDVRVGRCGPRVHAVVWIGSGHPSLRSTPDGRIVMPRLPSDARRICPARHASRRCSHACCTFSERPFSRSSRC